MRPVLCIIAMLTLNGCIGMMLAGSAISTGQHINAGVKIKNLEKRIKLLEAEINEDNKMFGVKYKNKPYCLSVDPRCEK